MKKALQQREQNQMDNLAWLDEDLKKKVEEKEERERIYEENISRIKNAGMVQRWSKTLLELDSPSEIISEMDPDTEELKLLIRVAQADKDRSSVQETPMTSEERVSRAIGVTIRFQKNAASLSTVDDRKWKIKRDVILNYLESSKDEDWKKHRKEFRRLIYNDTSYLEWSKSQEEGGPGPGYSLRTSGKVLVITAGANWLNWKDEKKEWQCKSFHYVKQIYDAMAKRQKTK